MSVTYFAVVWTSFYIFILLYMCNINTLYTRTPMYTMLRTHFPNSYGFEITAGVIYPKMKQIEGHTHAEKNLSKFPSKTQIMGLGAVVEIYNSENWCVSSPSWSLQPTNYHINLSQNMKYVNCRKKLIMTFIIVIGIFLKVGLTLCNINW